MAAATAAPACWRREGSSLRTAGFSEKQTDEVNSARKAGRHQAGPREGAEAERTACAEAGRHDNMGSVFKQDTDTTRYEFSVELHMMWRAGGWVRCQEESWLWSQHTWFQAQFHTRELCGLGKTSSLISDSSSVKWG